MAKGQGLTYKQRSFIDLYFLYEQDAVKACIEAGYSPKSANTTGNKLLHNPMIARIVKNKRDRLNIRTENTIESRVKTAVDILELSLTNKKFQIALSANEQLIKLGGFYAPENTTLTVVSHVERLKQLQSLEEQGLLTPYKPIEAEYSDIKDKRPLYSGSEGFVEGDEGEGIGVESDLSEADMADNG